MRQAFSSGCGASLAPLPRRSPDRAIMAAAPPAPAAPAAAPPAWLRKTGADCIHREMTSLHRSIASGALPGIRGVGCHPRQAWLTVLLHGSLCYVYPATCTKRVALRFMVRTRHHSVPCRPAAVACG